MYRLRLRGDPRIQKVRGVVQRNQNVRDGPSLEIRSMIIHRIDGSYETHVLFASIRDLDEKCSLLIDAEMHLRFH